MARDSATPARMRRCRATPAVDPWGARAKARASGERNTGNEPLGPLMHTANVVVQELDIELQSTGNASGSPSARLLPKFPCHGQVRRIRRMEKMDIRFRYREEVFTIHLVQHGAAVRIQKWWRQLGCRMRALRWEHAPQKPSPCWQCGSPYP